MYPPRGLIILAPLFGGDALARGGGVLRGVQAMEVGRLAGLASD